MPFNFKTLRKLLRSTIENRNFNAALKIIEELKKEFKIKQEEELKKKIDEFSKVRDQRLKEKIEEFKRKYMHKLDLRKKKIEDEVNQKYNQLLHDIFSCEIAIKQNDTQIALECFKTVFPRLKVELGLKETKITEPKKEKEEEIVEASIEENYLDELAKCLNLTKEDAETYASMLQKEASKQDLKIDVNTAAYCYLTTRNYNYKEWKNILKKV